jgi:hypothetical protein
MGGGGAKPAPSWLLGRGGQGFLVRQGPDGRGGVARHLTNITNSSGGLGGAKRAAAGGKAGGAHGAHGGAGSWPPAKLQRKQGDQQKGGSSAKQLKMSSFFGSKG